MTRAGVASTQGQSRWKIVVLLMLVAAITSSAAICQIWTRLRAIQFGYKISQASKENRRLQELNKKLRLEVALLKNPARIALIAQSELGLQPPRPEQIRRLRYQPGRTIETIERIPKRQPLARVTP